MKPKNLFTTKTLQGAFAMIIGFVIATSPILSDLIDRKFDKKTAEDLKLYLGMVVVGGGFLRTTYGRYQATDDVYTPSPLVGRKPEDIH
jgi:dipeptide/tripeptide permease